MSKCSRHHCQYVYNASASGVAAEIDRPVTQSVHTQGATTLASLGGRGSHRVENFRLEPFISFDAAYTEVGGSFDECHNLHATYAHSVIEGLNIADVVTADRVVSRMVVYSPTVKDGTCEQSNPKDEHRFDITGSHFVNLKVAGRSIEIELAAHTLRQHETFTAFEEGFLDSGGEGLLPWGAQSEQRLNLLQRQEADYHALGDIGARAKAWKKSKKRQAGATYRCSPAGHLDINKKIPESEILGFGSIILVPKFGVVRLAEMIVNSSQRRLTMIRVQMCSGSGGSSCGGTTGVGGGRPIP